jgi:hypothetical protein
VQIHTYKCKQEPANGLLRIEAKGRLSCLDGYRQDNEIINQRNQKTEMQNDKVFIAYAVALVVGISTLMAFVLGTGASALPSPMYLLEHVGLGLAIRAFYKSFDGESGFYAVANTIHDYFGLGLEHVELPSSMVPATH